MQGAAPFGFKGAVLDVAVSASLSLPSLVHQFGSTLFLSFRNGGWERDSISSSGGWRRDSMGS